MLYFILSNKASSDIESDHFQLLLRHRMLVSQHSTVSCISVSFTGFHSTPVGIVFCGFKHNVASFITGIACLLI